MVLKHYLHVFDSQKLATIEAIPEPQYVAICAKQHYQPITHC